MVLFLASASKNTLDTTPMVWSHFLGIFEVVIELLAELRVDNFTSRDWAFNKTSVFKLVHGVVGLSICKGVFTVAMIQGKSILFNYEECMYELN